MHPRGGILFLWSKILQKKEIFKSNEIRLEQNEILIWNGDY